MKSIITLQAAQSLEHVLDFLELQQIPPNKVEEIMESILARIDSLSKNPYKGQLLNFKNTAAQYRRIVYGYYKIVYYIQNDCIYVTDIFDSRQDPDKMKA